VPVVGVLAALWILVLGVPNAVAAVASSSVTSPANGTIAQQNGDNRGDPAHQITVSGTTTNDGTPGNVDLICTFGNSDGSTGDSLIAPNIAVDSNGNFSFSGPVPAIEQPCVIRAVPASGSIPADLSPFTGPKVAFGDFDTTTVLSGPNVGQVYDFFDNGAQFSGDGDYASVGRGGLFDAWPVDPSTLVKGADLFFSNDYLSAKNNDRSDIEVDGIPAYPAYAAATLLSFKGEGFSGLPAVTFTHSQDPITGDLTIQESEMLVQCAPTPATYPATAASCTSFAPTGVRFDRTIVQNQDGRQAQLTDTYTSVDGKQHAIDLRYGQDFQNPNPGFNFPWVDESTYNTHAPGDTEVAPPSAPVSMFVNANNAIADGDLSSAEGAITFASKPNGFTFVQNGNFGDVHFDVAYTRTVPAGGSTTLKTTYSWAFTKADAHSLAMLAEQQDLSAPAVTTGAATAITTSGATVSGSVNPNGSDTKYQFQYGTTTSYGNATTLTDAGTGTSSSNVSATLSGLAPGTTYHYRLVATNAAHTTNGSDATFKTAPTPPPPPPPPPPTKLKVGHIKINGDRASIPLSCTGAATAVCRGTLAETIRVTVRVKHHRKQINKTVASERFSIKASAGKTVKLTLNRTGRKALAASSSHKLRVTLTVRLAGKKVTAKTLTFKAAHKRTDKHKRHKGT
jgi:hypothetical protein